MWNLSEINTCRLFKLYKIFILVFCINIKFYLLYDYQILFMDYLKISYVYLIIMFIYLQHFLFYHLYIKIPHLHHTFEFVNYVKKRVTCRMEENFIYAFDFFFICHRATIIKW